jgi:hypothetical protein
MLLIAKDLIPIGTLCQAGPISVPLAQGAVVG